MPLLTATITIDADVRLFVKALLRRDPLTSGRGEVLVSEAVGRALEVLALGKGHEEALRVLDVELTRTTEPRSR